MWNKLLPIACLAVLLASPNVSATLIGDDITVTNTFNGGNLFEGPTTVTADDTGVPELFNFGLLWDIDFQDNSIHMTCTAGGDGNACGIENALVGITDEYLFEGLDWGGMGFLSGATLNAASTVAGATVSLISPTSVQVVYSVPTLSVGDRIWIDLAAVHVPAPATLALFGLGFAGLGWSMRNKA